MRNIRILSERRSFCHNFKSFHYILIANTGVQTKEGTFFETIFLSKNIADEQGAFVPDLEFI